VPFNFFKECLTSFNTLKEKLIPAPVIAVPKWTLSFELVWDISDYVVEGVLGQRWDKILYVIYYASPTLTDVRLNFSTTELHAICLRL
jgi:hypothetical protein